MTRLNKKQRVARIIEGMNSPDGWIPAASSSPESAIEPEPQLICKCGSPLYPGFRMPHVHSEADDALCTELTPTAASSAIEVAPRKEWAGSGNYIADREQAPQWVAFANGRTVGIAMPPDGEPYLVVGVEQPGERWLRTKAAEESDAGSIGVGGLAVDVGLYTLPSVAPGEAQREGECPACDRTNPSQGFCSSCAVPSEVAPSREQKLEDALREVLDLLSFHEGSGVPAGSGNSVIVVNEEDWNTALRVARAALEAK